MSEPNKSRSQIAIWLLLLFAFTAVFYCLILVAHKLEAGYLVIWILGFGGFPNQEFMGQLVDRKGLKASPTVSTVVYLILVGSVGLVHSIADGLGEEIGCQGFLVPELFKTIGFTGTALFSGIVWALWHYPVLIGADYDAGTPAWYSLTCITVMVLALSFIFAWMRLKSGSLWTAALLYASHNLYAQSIFTPLTHNSDNTPWFLDEFGVVLPIVAIAFAIFFWSRRGQLQPILPQPTGQPLAVTG